MTQTPKRLKQEQRLVAATAASLIEPGMRIGIGSGSTVGFFIEALGRRSTYEGLAIDCVVASSESGRLAGEAGLRVAGFEMGLPLDLVVDGADEIDVDLDMIKGGGGALLRERIVAAAGTRVLIIGDSSKVVSQLGGFRLPVEVVRFGAELARRDLKSLGLAPTLRRTMAGEPFVTDEGNWIFDCETGVIADKQALTMRLANVTAVAAHGLFVGIANEVLIADNQRVHLRKRGGLNAGVEQGSARL